MSCNNKHTERESHHVVFQIIYPTQIKKALLFISWSKAGNTEVNNLVKWVDITFLVILCWEGSR